MKSSIILSLALCLAAFSANAQSFTSAASGLDRVPGELIVKFKDPARLGAAIDQQTGQVLSLDSAAIRLILGSEAVSSIDYLFEPSIAPELLSRSSAAGIEPQSYLKPVMRVFYNGDINLRQEINRLEQHPAVDYAEPNFIVNISDMQPVSPALTESEAMEWVKSHVSKTTKMEGVTPNDPLYAGQTNTSLTKIDEVWNQTTGNGQTLIAILDTGVDKDHPDLADNIWYNQAEVDGIEGYDDDGNGYIDDMFGWDFINEDNLPLDDNSHGTHVAGIAAAVGNNGIGITGAIWDAKIMSVKVFQSSGRGDVATIARGIEYAANNGAHLLNMSFGTYAESVTLRRALEDAYINAILVASAGNDGRCIGPGIGCAPLYPGAYAFVLGVEDNPKPPGGYTNFDQDGPVFSKYPNLLNYEVTSPGTSIMSTIPGGGYRAYTGTSMSAPLLAGAMALYNETKPGDSKELMFGNLINTSGTYFNLEGAIAIEPRPDLKVITAEIIDTLNSQNGDYQADVGETIQIKPTIKNYWGPTDSVFIAIEFAEFEDRTKATLIDSVQLIGSTSAYATLARNEYPLSMEIAEGLANNVDISFKLKTWSRRDTTNAHVIDYVVNVKNAIKFSGYINYDITLTADKKYLVNDQLVIADSAVMTIKPGVTLETSEGIKIKTLNGGRINAIGTRDSLIHFRAEDSSWDGMDFEIYGHWVTITGLNTWDSSVNLRELVHSQVYGNTRGVVSAGIMRYNNFTDNYRGTQLRPSVYRDWRTNEIIRDLRIHNNSINNLQTASAGVVEPSGEGQEVDSIRLAQVIGNGFNNRFSVQGGLEGVAYIAKVYLGSADSLRVRETIEDFFTGCNTCPIIDISNRLKEPDSLAHGIVWKVLVNGKDTQDEYEELDPLGIGEYTFDVYFNRSMDTTYTPQVSMGVREPYNQEVFTEEGDWSDDGKVYTIKHTVGLRSADGINRIRVQDARDPDNFEVPIEATRFNVLVQAAGSASAGFNANPGIGKVDLSWEAPSEFLDDILGYGVFRFEALTDSTYSDTLKLNTNPLESTEFTDYEVSPGTKYFYFYNTVRTNFNETDRSRILAATPQTAELGDANGDTQVNILDVNQAVNHILGVPAFPFLYYAADVNDDSTINVLDVVGIVDLALSASTGNRTDPRNIDYISSDPVGTLDLFWQNDTLYAISPAAVAGLQLAFAAESQVQWMDDLAMFDKVAYSRDGQSHHMLFSMANRTIPAGKIALFTVEERSDLISSTFSAKGGLPLNVRYDANILPGSESEPLSTAIQLGQSYPNPTSDRLNIPYWLPENVDQVALILTDRNGRAVVASDELPNTAGRHDIAVDLTNQPPGLYVYRLVVQRGGYILYQGGRKALKQ